jgi:hypothetical protein
MASQRKLFDLEQKTCDAARGNFADMEVLHASIYTLAMQAFRSNILTLSRMTVVLQEMQRGIEDTRSFETDLSRLAQVQIGAYRGLCRAACEGLIAADLACAEFIKLNGVIVTADFKNAINQEALELGRQFDQVINRADCGSNTQISLLLSHWFDRLNKFQTSNFTSNALSEMPWNDRFFQLCGFSSMVKNNETQANLMLLGLITNGALGGVKNFQLAG